MEELEHALKRYNMGDAKTIKEIIAEVDTDHVLIFHFIQTLSETVIVIFSDFIMRTQVTGKRLMPKKFSLAFIFLAVATCLFRNINYSLLSFLQDGRINYEEFAAMMRKGNPELAPGRRRK